MTRLHPAMSGAATLQSFKQFLGRFEREVVQQDHDFLFVTGVVFRSADDQRSGEHALLLQGVGVHPMGTAGAYREPVISYCSGSERRSRIVRYAVHAPRRRQAMPVDEGIR
ncbi:Hypothetical protein NGAL_HAMBI2605_12400 [Neorhizobium galegae bv. orientalis]|nr:Hypothetical protein NGAL_HAMBI2605_12400 [Neorhizobium galegae bv. orientalis]